MVSVSLFESRGKVFPGSSPGELRWRDHREWARISSRVLLLFLLCLSPVSLPVWGQVTGGVLTGTVSDPGGAVIPDAKVVVKNLGTNVEYRTQTTSAGLYVLPNLPAGTYSLSLEMTGFQKYLRSPVQISQGTTLGLNVVLQVGRVTETVEVTAAAAQLQTASSEVSHQVSPKFIQELPLVGGGEARDTEAFMFLLPGVSGNSWQAHINGGQAFTKEITVDGVSNNLSTVQGSFFESAPPYEAMAEFKLDVSNYSAEYGSAQAGMTQFQMKSGTNNFHGSVFNSVGNDILNANDILSNSGRSGQPPDAQGNAFQPATRSWTIGLSAGGPLSIPRVYSGRDKTFIFSAFEGATFRQGVFGSLETYPVQSLLQGDFSSLLGASVGTDCLGRTVLRGQIYDPSTTRLCPDGVTFVRDPFINNQVPIASTIARNLITEMPVIGGPQTRNNFPGGGGQPFRNIAHWLIKADHSISDRQKVIGSYNYAWRKRKHASGSLDDEHLITRWTDQTVRTQNARFVYDFTLRPNLLNHFTLGYSRFTNPHFVASIGKDISRLGFKGLPRLDLGLPEINFSGGSVAYSSLGRGGPRDDLVENNFSFSDNLAWIKGRHSLKIGLEYRASQLNDTNFGDSNGSFNFRPFQTRLPGFAATGDPFASFLLGEVKDRKSVV